MRNRKWTTWLLTGLLVVAAYFINVEVQSYLGKKALEKTGLISVSLAEAIATSEQSPILVDVSAIWCPSCRRLDEVIFSDDLIKHELSHWKFVRLEYESAEGEAFLEAQRATGFPNLFALSPEGEVVRHLQVTYLVNEMFDQLKDVRESLELKQKVALN